MPQFAFHQGAILRIIIDQKDLIRIQTGRLFSGFPPRRVDSPWSDREERSPRALERLRNFIQVHPIMMHDLDHFLELIEGNRFDQV